MATISISCPQCNSDSFLNPNIQILLSPCYHKICTTCLQRLFPLGHGKCPECGALLRKTNFFQSTFEDIEVERECQIRKKLSITKSKESDFKSKMEYYDYLEDFENKVFFVLKLNPAEAKIFFEKENKREPKSSSSLKRSRLFNQVTFDSSVVIKDKGTDSGFVPEVIKRFECIYIDVMVPKCFKVKNFGSLTDEDIMQIAVNSVSHLF
ncbi:RNA polymerase II transcription factor B subunit 3 [Cucumispora dikerogammari]|nr:RNA polymerase II transcription factor B subunit 3 [Cucumispora dikerogammari]